MPRLRIRLQVGDEDVPLLVSGFRPLVLHSVIFPTGVIHLHFLTSQLGRPSAPLETCLSRTKTGFPRRWLEGRLVVSARTGRPLCLSPELPENVSPMPHHLSPVADLFQFEDRT